MSFILKFLGGPFGMYILIAVAVLLAGMATTITIQSYRIDALQSEGEKWKKEATDVAGISAAKDLSIEILRVRLADITAAAEHRAEQVREASKHLASMTADLQASIIRIQTLEESDRELPDCQALMRIDLAAVCPATARGMRERAARAPTASDH